MNEIIDLDVEKRGLEQAVDRAREKGICIPTLEQMKNPRHIPEAIKNKLTKVGLWEIDPLNLFRISWKNVPTRSGGLYNGVNYMEIPSQLSGVDARIIALIGKWFPTGSHKVGATFGCLVPRLITGQFDPKRHKAVWPSTGNFCRGGAYNSQLLGSDSIAILPREMSQERFDWLSKVAGEVIATPGCESNVKEIYDKCWELKKERDDVVIFNQFSEFGNHLWHYEVTGQACEEVLDAEVGENSNYAGLVLTSGSSGTLGCGDYLKQLFPRSKLAVGEALQCPTLLRNGYGGHKIEGIGDKHVPWIHNVRNTDMVMAIDDNSSVNLLRLFNERVGKEYLSQCGVSQSVVDDLNLLGISSVANLVGCIKFARYYELGPDDVILTIFTDSIELYQTRLRRLRRKYGEYKEEDAVKDFHLFLRGIKTDNMEELGYYQKKRIHNLKYFTWVEQQGKDVQELDKQWYEWPVYWDKVHSQSEEIDRLIEDFNRRVGLSWG